MIHFLIALKTFIVLILLIIKVNYISFIGQIFILCNIIKKKKILIIFKKLNIIRIISIIWELLNLQSINFLILIYFQTITKICFI